ncbi:MAG: four helix bundle protein [Bacteroidales bacterium]|nr:four helix bundle protein [Bacteroidales bacterium]
MDANELKSRLKQFALRIMNLADSMPKDKVSSWAIAKQIVRSGTSPFANYRAACRAKSDKDFLNKLKMVIEELDETGGWLELIEEYSIFPQEKLALITKECDELTRIIQSSINTIKSKLND